jgi:hypothetical protein
MDHPIPSYPILSEVLSLKQLKFFSMSLSNLILSYIYNFRWTKVNFPESLEKENLLAEFTKILFFQKLNNNDLQGALTLIRDQIKCFKTLENQKSSKIC